MSKPTAGSMLADLLEARELGITPEELNDRRLALEKQIELQGADTPGVKITAMVYIKETRPPKND